MKKPAAHPTTNISSESNSSSDSLNIGREFVDTTWRIAVPVLLFAGIGLAADRGMGTKPWMTLLGVLIGFIFAVLLVKQQIVAGESVVEHYEEHQK